MIARDRVSNRCPSNRWRRVSIAGVMLLATYAGKPALGVDTPTLLYSINGFAAGDNFGTHVNGVKDTIGGTKLLVGSRSADPNGLCNSGAAYVFRGANAALLYTLPGTQGNGAVFPKCGSVPGGEFGRFTAVIRDIDNDGVEDLIIGSPLANTTDPNNSSNLFPKAGEVFVYSGRTGGLIYDLAGPVATLQMGRSVASVPDVDGDGVDDILAGAPGNAEGSGGNLAIGRAFLYSGATGKLLTSFQGESVNDQFGFFSTGIGDLDGDGRGDLIIGARFGDPIDPVSGQTLTDAGIVTVYSGRTG